MSRDKKNKIEIRLTLHENEEWYDYFVAIKEKLGTKKNAEVIRQLIKYYYDKVFGGSPSASGEKPSQA